MKINWSYIKVFFLISLLSVTYAFTSHRNSSKNVKNVTVEFAGAQNLYLTSETVNKLLIQSLGSLKNVPKENIDLNTIENALKANKMVKSAQVYLTVNGNLTSKIVQKSPIARVEGVTKFYLDDEGKRMPLSKNHSARVPIISGRITDASLENAFVVLQYINADDFLKKNVIGIHLIEQGRLQLKLRLENFVVNLGNAKNLEAKFNNYKAFYHKAVNDKILNSYKAISLEYNNQVVCTKK